VRALRDGRSLLPAGVSAALGEFDRGDPVRIVTADGGQIGCGLSAYSAREISLIAGQHTSAIESALGYRGRDEIIHRDDMVLNMHGRSE